MADESELDEQMRDREDNPDLDINDPPTTPPPLIHEVHEHDGRRWPTILVYLLLALLVAAILVFAGRTIYRATHHESSEPQPAANSGQAPAKPGESSNSGSSSSSGSSNKSTASSGSSGQPNTGAVPNTGPGSTVAIFTATTIAAASLHYIWSLRRSAKTS